MINKEELLYKIDAIIEYLKENGGLEYKIYNHLCPDIDNEPDSNIVEYAEDVKNMIETLLILKNLNEINIEDLLIKESDLPF